MKKFSIARCYLTSFDANSPPEVERGNLEKTSKKDNCAKPVVKSFIKILIVEIEIKRNVDKIN